MRKSRTHDGISQDPSRREKVTQEDNHPLGRLEAKDAVPRHVDNRGRVVQRVLDGEGEQEQSVVGPVKVSHGRADDELILVRLDRGNLGIAPVLTPRVELLQKGAHEHRVVEVGVQARDGAGIGIEDIDHATLCTQRGSARKEGKSRLSLSLSLKHLRQSS